MTNTHLDSVDESADVSTFNQYRLVRHMGLPKQAGLWLVNRATRDHARTPVQWSDAVGAGFVGGDGTAAPWYPLNPNYVDINVEAAEQDPQSLLAFYRAAIALRRRLDVVREGTYREFKHHSSVIYAYARESATQRLLVVCSLTDKTAYFSAHDDYDLAAGELCLCNYPDAPLQGKAFFLRPYECRVYLWEDGRQG